MLNELARAQLAEFLASIQDDASKTISLVLLRQFIGQEGVDEIKSMKADLAKAKKDNKNTTDLSDGAKMYWRRFKLLSRQASRAELNSEAGREEKFHKLSERLRDDFWHMVPALDQLKFRIHNGPEDEANWDDRWEGLEGRPPLLRREFEQGFNIDKPMNFAQQNVISRFLVPSPTAEEQATRTADLKATIALVRSRPE